MNLLRFTNKISDSELSEIEARADTQIKLDTLEILQSTQKEKRNG